MTTTTGNIVEQSRAHRGPTNQFAICWICCCGIDETHFFSLSNEAESTLSGAGVVIVLDNSPHDWHRVCLCVWMRLIVVYTYSTCSMNEYHSHFCALFTVDGIFWRTCICRNDSPLVTHTQRSFCCFSVYSQFRWCRTKHINIIHNSMAHTYITLREQHVFLGSGIRSLYFLRKAHRRLVQFWCYAMTTTTAATATSS